MSSCPSCSDSTAAAMVTASSWGRPGMLHLCSCFEWDRKQLKRQRRWCPQGVPLTASLVWLDELWAVSYKSQDLSLVLSPTLWERPWSPRVTLGCPLYDGIWARESLGALLTSFWHSHQGFYHWATLTFLMPETGGAKAGGPIFKRGKLHTLCGFRRTRLALARACGGLEGGQQRLQVILVKRTYLMRSLLSMLLAHPHKWLWGSPLGDRRPAVCSLAVYLVTFAIMSAHV
jgi:hypothetical protein